MDPLVPYFGLDNIRVMQFVDGENLANRFGCHIRNQGVKCRAGALYIPGVCLWWEQLSSRHVVKGGGIIRTHYYTAVQGDEPSIESVSEKLKNTGVSAPRVFKKPKGMPSKQVDVTLATEMLLHATRRNYDIAILVAGDSDYVPLVRAVQSEGRGVHVWFIPDGLSPKLVQAADHYVDISGHLVSPQASDNG